MRRRNAEPSAPPCLGRAGRRFLAAVAMALVVFYGFFGSQAQEIPSRPSVHQGVGATRARRLLAQHGWPVQGVQVAPQRTDPPAVMPQLTNGTGSTASWQSLGPAAVNTASYGLVSGRVSSIAFDPADPTGNRVYIGTTGGGVWLSQNVGTGDTANVQFVPLTDTVGVMTYAYDASLSIGAITVQPGGTGVVLVGTGDPNDALDSYYGAGILRSTDGGNTWSLIPATADQEKILIGEALAGFAWSTANPQLVVAAVSQALESVLTNATRVHASYEGLYYSSDSGATWSLARITDGNGSDVQGPTDAFVVPDGNAATSVVWNPVRQVFLAAVRYHGYYQSTDGITWSRLSAQPGSGLTLANCPTNLGLTGSLSCPIFRGTLAVNPQTGDTFAWTVDVNKQDQGIWQDQCVLSAGACANLNLTFGKRWSTAALETPDGPQRPATIEDGDFTLALAAVPSGQDTLLLAGADDVWKCGLAAGCVWRNTTNTSTCRSGQVAPYQHALAWSATNPLEILIGNDSGLWRSLDAVGETGATCDAGDSTHFQNLNGQLGSLAEVGSLALADASSGAVIAGLGTNGTTGVNSTAGPTADWPQILDGYGGPVAIDTQNSGTWYANNQAGVSIHACAQGTACTPATFGAAVVTNADVGGDGNTMPSPAPFLVDPLDPSQLLIGTCRVWRGPANGSGWTRANAISPFLDGMQGSVCGDDDPLIRILAAQSLGDGSEVVYAGMYGLDGGGTLAGHVFKAIYNPDAGSVPTWNDLIANPVSNDTVPMNQYGFDISGIFIDSHDATGNTVYVTIDGMPAPLADVSTVYGSTDGGAHWQTLVSNLPLAPANAIAVDPQDPSTVYLALDSGVFATQRVGNCLSGPGNCWSPYGSGLPESPVVQLAIAGNQLVAGTYGRGVWEIPLWSGNTQLTTTNVNPLSISFATQAFDSTSAPQAVTVTNTGSIALTVSSVAATGDFDETDNCQGNVIGSGASCTIQITFTPTQPGTRTGQLTIDGNIEEGQLSVPLSGTGASPTGVALIPSTVDFGSVPVGATSSPLQITVENPTSAAVPVTSVGIAGPFVLSANACGASLAANSDCQLLIAFAPAQAGAATGTLTLVDSAGRQTVALNGSGAAPPTDTLSQNALTFVATIVGQVSAPQTLSMTNSGGVPLTSIAATVSGPFQVSGTCATQLVANSSCTFIVVFDPTSTGSQTGALTIADALRTQTVALSGTGLAPPQIAVNPAALSFPVQPIGVASAPVSLTIGNTGGAAMANIGFQITGVSSGSFSIGTSTCGATLNNGSSCTVQLIFTPTTAGGAAATLTISSSTLGVRAARVPLTGTGQAPAGINVSPAQMTFTTAMLGQASNAQVATVTNTAARVANGLSLVVNAPFSLEQSSCGTTLAAGASCSVNIVFTPVANGAVTSTLSITSTTLNSAVVILNGIGGVPGAVQVQPGVLSFPITGVGATSGPQTVTLTNTGPVDLTTLTLNASSGFQVKSSTCAATLAVSATCTAEVAFAPSTAGQQTGNLNVSSTALPTPARAVLAGMGFDFGVTIAGASGQSIASGQIARFTLVLSPMNGSSGTFTFQCGSLPVGAACSFNPASETVGPNTTGNLTVQIATGHTSSMRRPSGSAWGVGTMVCGLVILPWALRRRRRLLLLAIGFVLIVGGVSSCAGSGGGTGGTPQGGPGGSNAVGTYAIPVSVSANGVTHTVTVSLTVD